MPRGGGSSSHGGGHGGFSSHSHSGGSRSGSSSSRGGFSSHSGSGRSSSSSSSSSYSRPLRTGSGPVRSRPPVTGGYGRPGRAGFSGPRRGLGCGLGCGGYALLGIRLFLIIGVLLANDPDTQTVTQTAARTRLAASLCTESASWYEDGWGDWIDDDSEADQRALLNGLRAFYTSTGVQPYLYITGPEGASIPDTGALEDAAVGKYRDLFRDEGHLVLIFREYPNASGDYLSGCYVGADAESVLDAEAREILLTDIDRYYENESLSDSRMFANAFSDAASRIMQTGTAQPPEVGGGQRSGYSIFARVFLIAVFVAIGVFIVRRAWKKNTLQSEPSAASTADELRKTDDASVRARSTVYTVVKCPYCGAQTKILKDAGGLCEYCGMKVTDNE